MPSSKVIRRARLDPDTLLVQRQRAGSGPGSSLEAPAPGAREPDLQPHPEAEIQAERARAREAGYLEGLEQARQETAASVDVLRDLARGARLEKAQMLHDAEREAVELILLIARKVTQRELLMDPEAVLQAVRSAFDAATSSTVVRVKVHPDDRPVVQEQWAVLLADQGAEAAIELAADPAIERGGCVIDTMAGYIDARKETVLGVIERALSEQAGVVP